MARHAIPSPTSAKGKTHSLHPPSQYLLNMSHNQTPHQGVFGYQLANASPSVAAPASPTRPGTTQDTRLPPFSSLLEPGAGNNLANEMDTGNPSQDMNVDPSQTTTRFPKTPLPSQLQSPHSRASTASPRIPSHPISSSPPESVVPYDQSISLHCMTESQNLPNSHRSPNTGPQPVGSTINVACNAPLNSFHIATMQGDQMVVNIGTVTPKPASDELVPWEPRKPSGGGSPCMPLNSILKPKDSQQSAYRQEKDTVLDKRSHQFPGKEPKKMKYSDGTKLAASLDDLAREYARSGISSSSVAIPSSVPTWNGGQSSGLVHSRGCITSPLTDNRDGQSKERGPNASKYKTFEQKNESASRLQNRRTTEHGHGLDFLASVILSQNNPPERESPQPGSGSLAVSITRQDTPNATFHPLAAAPDQGSPSLNVFETEPRSEASDLKDDQSPKSRTPLTMRILGQRSSVFPVHVTTDESLASIENNVSNQAHMSVSAPQADEISPDVQVSSPGLAVTTQPAKNVRNTTSVYSKGGINYKLKRGPRSKKEKQDRVSTSNGNEGKEGKDLFLKERLQGARSHEARASPSIGKGNLSKRCYAANENRDEIQPNPKASQSSRYVYAGSSPTAFAMSKETVLMSGIPSNSTGSKKNLQQKNCRSGKSQRDQGELSVAQGNHEDNDQLSCQKRKSHRGAGETPCSPAIEQAIQADRKLDGSRKAQDAEKEAHQPVPIEKEAPANAPAYPDVTAASCQISLQAVTAAAKSSPPYDHKCEQCGSLFNRRFNLNKHIRNVHENIRKFDCTKCGELFLQKSHLAAHILAVHDKSRPFRCELCPKRFSWIGVLRKHMQAIHKITLQRKITRKGRSQVLKGIERDSENIHPIRLDGKDAALATISSPAQNEIIPLATKVVVTPETPVLFDA